MRRGVKVSLIIGGVILLGAAGVLGWLTQTPEPGPVYEPDANNTAVHAALLDRGFTEAAVDVTPERVLVRYEKPDNMSVNRSIFLAASQTANAAPETDLIVLQVYENNEPVVQATIEIERLQAFLNQDTEFQSFWESVEFRSAS